MKTDFIEIMKKMDELEDVQISDEVLGKLREVFELPPKLPEKLVNNRKSNEQSHLNRVTQEEKIESLKFENLGLYDQIEKYKTKIKVQNKALIHFRYSSDSTTSRNIELFNKNKDLMESLTGMREIAEERKEKIDELKRANRGLEFQNKPSYDESMAIGRETSLLYENEKLKGKIMELEDIINDNEEAFGNICEVSRKLQFENKDLVEHVAIQNIMIDSLKDEKHQLLTFMDSQKYKVDYDKNEIIYGSERNQKE